MAAAETLFTTQQPSVASASDGVPYELGMKFQAAKPGKITAIRYYKAAQDPGVHTGHIWSAGGQELASVTFQNETASGWQEAALATPLAIQAGITYVVSVNVGANFPITLNGLTNAVTNVALSSVADGANGVFGTSGGFPSGSWSGSNYFRDVVFVADTATASLAKAAGDNQSGAVATALSAPLVVEARTAAGALASGVPVTFAVTSGGGTVSPATATTDASGHAQATLTLGPAAGTNTVAATATNFGSVTFSATAAAAATQTSAGGQSLFTTQTPSITDGTDGGVSYELGMKFRSAKSGKISAIRYWKAPSDTGAHTGRIWDAAGTLLASVNFSAETSSGWQQATLSTPLAIAANTTYVVSVNVNSYYTMTLGGLSSAVANGDLSSVPDGANGLFGTPGAFPNNSWNSSNYFRDVVFVADATSTATPTSSPQPTTGGASLFTTQAPSITNGSDGGVSYELGMKFRSGRSGKITAIRYWKAPSDTGSHTGRIWSAGGGALASVNFTGETASGWQQAALATPLAIAANTTYVVSVNANSYFTMTPGGLSSAVINGDLSSVADGLNGVYGSPGTFPSGSYNSSNYFRDVVFVVDNVPTITKVSGDNQSAAPGAVLASPLVVEVRDAAGSLKANAAVTFAVTGGGGSVTPTTASTDASGRASAALTLGSAAGTNTVTASTTGAGSVTFTASAGSASTTANRIVAENKLAGTTAWRLTNPVTPAAPEIAGYASATSVNVGGSLPLKISAGGQYTVDVYRLGYYGGTGGRLMASSGTLTGSTQSPCQVTDQATLLIECKWSTSYTVQVGSDWISGLYVANLTRSDSGKQSQIWFVVRDDSASADIVVQSAFNTFQAYNHYGTFEQHSLYAFNSTGGQRALKVSLDRPFGQVTTDQARYDKMLDYEYHMARWLESQGYNVTYVSDVDVHANPGRLQKFRVALVAGHSEYWTKEMRDAFDQARDAGVNLAFLSANTAYWRVRFEPSSSGESNRVIACYKEPAVVDPVAPTYLWRGPENNRPENALLGVMYIGDNVNDQYAGYAFVPQNTGDPWFRNTGLSDGASLGLLVGFEWDAVVNNGFTPSGLVVLGKSSVSPTETAPGLPQGTDLNLSHAVRYTAPSGAKVVSSGSIQWLWALDSDGVRSPREDTRLKQFVVNFLADMGARPATPSASIVLP